jgi:hypothetical protein
MPGIRATKNRKGIGRSVFYIVRASPVLGNGPIGTHSDNRRGVFYVVRATHSDT